MTNLTQGIQRVPQHACVTFMERCDNAKLSTVHKKVQNRAYLLMIILVIVIGQLLFLLRKVFAVSAQNYRHLKLNSYRLVARLFLKTRFYCESYLPTSQAKNSRSKKIVFRHDDLVRHILHYADLKHIPRESQVWLVESALEYLAVMQILPEENVTQWPEEGVIGGFQSFKGEGA